MSAPASEPIYNVQTAQATLEACTHDLSEEDDRCWAKKHKDKRTKKVTYTYPYCGKEYV